MVVYLDTSEISGKGRKTLKTFRFVGLFQKGIKRRYSSVHRNRTEIYMTLITEDEGAFIEYEVSNDS